MNHKKIQINNTVLKPTPIWAIKAKRATKMLAKNLWTGGTTKVRVATEEGWVTEYSGRSDKYFKGVR